MKVIDIDQIGSVVHPSRPRQRVVVSGNGAVPWRSLDALDAVLHRYKLHLLNAPRGLPDRAGITYETAFVGPGMRGDPRLDYIPCRLSHVPHLFIERLPIDVCLVHTSLPYDGKVSLGCEVNILPTAVAACKAHGGIVIAQMNKQMPYTFGDGELDLDIFDAFIEVDEPLNRVHEVPPLPPGETASPHAVTAMLSKAKQPPPPTTVSDVQAANGDWHPSGLTRQESAHIIGDLCSARILDGATMQLGIGEIPDATLAGLVHKKGLGIWSEMLADGVLLLDEAGALDPDRMIVSSFVHGSTELYEWVHRNPRVRILRTETTNAPARIAENPGMTSINTALQVDLFDQANASRIRRRIFSGFGGQTDFTVGAMHSRGGQALMALRSWHPKANVSTIVPLIDGPVTSFQHSAVVTENGVAEISGYDEMGQAANLIRYAAHPAAWGELWAQAAQMGLA